MKKIILVCCILVISCTAASAQNSRKQAQSNLIRAFIQKQVVVKMDMPGVDKGVEVLADKQNSTDAGKNLKRLKAFGTGIRSGDTAKVTNIRVTKDKISFELNGGGWPESMAGRGVGPVPPRANTTGNATPRINRASDSSRRDREQDQSRAKYESAERIHNEARTAAVNDAMRQGAIERLRAAGLQMGSRFVIKFDGRDTASVTPDELKRILADYVVF